MEVKLEDVRIAFFVGYDPKPFAGDPNSKPAYSVSPLIPKNSPLVKRMNAAIETAAKDKWNDKAAAVLKTLRAGDKTCLHDGDLKTEYEGFENHFFVSARGYTRPLILDRDKTPLTESDGKPYSGCYCNVVLDVWAQDNGFGKRINATVKGIQFVKDGDAFSGSAPASPDAFDDLSDGADSEALA